jgi:hypothetical protein
MSLNVGHLLMSDRTFNLNHLKLESLASENSGATESLASRNWGTIIEACKLGDEELMNTWGF